MVPAANRVRSSRSSIPVARARHPLFAVASTDCCTRRRNTTSCARATMVRIYAESGRNTLFSTYQTDARPAAPWYFALATVPISAGRCPTLAPCRPVPTVPHHTASARCPRCVKRRTLLSTRHTRCTARAAHLSASHLFTHTLSLPLRGACRSSLASPGVRPAHAITARRPPRPARCPPAALHRCLPPAARSPLSTLSLSPIRRYRLLQLATGVLLEGDGNFTPFTPSSSCASQIFSAPSRSFDQEVVDLTT